MLFTYKEIKKKLAFMQYFKLDGVQIRLHDSTVRLAGSTGFKIKHVS